MLLTSVHMALSINNVSIFQIDVVSARGNGCPLIVCFYTHLFSTTRPTRYQKVSSISLCFPFDIFDLHREPNIMSNLVLIDQDRLHREVVSWCNIVSGIHLHLRGRVPCVEIPLVVSRTDEFRTTGSQHSQEYLIKPRNRCKCFAIGTARYEVWSILVILVGKDVVYVDISVHFGAGFGGIDSYSSFTLENSATRAYSICQVVATYILGTWVL